MRALLTSLLLSCALACTGCKEEIPEICGFTTDPPDVDDGKGTATRSDGEDFNEDATWKAGSGGSLTMGVLDIIIEKEESGGDTADLIEDGAFPICVKLGDRGDKTGAANYIDGGYVTNAENTGAVVILSNDDDLLVGRFQAALQNPAGDALEFTDGAFSASLR